LLVHLSSGLRIGKVLALAPDNIYLDAQPVEIDVSSNWFGGHQSAIIIKNGTHSSSEGVSVLIKWLKFTMTG